MSDDIDELVGAPAKGDNSKNAAEPADASVASKQLKAIIERIERLEEDKRAVANDIKEVYAEAKGNGFDQKTIRRVIAIRKKPKDEVSEEQALLELYLSALGMLAE